MARPPITLATVVLLATFAAAASTTIVVPASAGPGGAAPVRDLPSRFVFPVPGPHDFGTSGSRFGAGRSGHAHQGQDVMAECGAALIAVRGGQVQYTGYEGSAGNYVVIDGRGTGFDMAYMHLAEPSLLQVGDMVRTGQSIGLVGDSGNAQGCHLHFEIWAAPGWYEGGSPIDPLPYLLRWDRYS